MARKNQTIMIAIVLAIVIIGGVCWWNVKHSVAPKEETFGQDVEVLAQPALNPPAAFDLIGPQASPHVMPLSDLVRETDLAGFGMGPGLVDSRRHNVLF